MKPFKFHSHLYTNLFAATFCFVYLSCIPVSGQDQDASFPIPPPVVKGATVVNFPDSTLESKVRALIGKPSGDILTTDLASDPNTTFDLNNAGVSDLSGIQYLTNLEWLWLDGNGLTDIGALTTMTNLKRLALEFNQITDLGPLANLTNLFKLFLKSNQITDLGPLVANSGLGSGDVLTLEDNPLSCEAVNVQLPALEARGVGVTSNSICLGTPTPTVTPGGPTLTPTHTLQPTATYASCSGANSQEQGYIQNFISYWGGQIPDSIPTLEEYAVPANYDRLYLGAANVWVDRINTDRNINAGMAWGSSYQTHSLNDMYRATGDRKYLEENLKIIRASMANQDNDHGITTFFGEIAPGWGTPEYAGRHVIHPVHTGMIGFGVIEFLELVQQEPEMMEDLGDEYDTLLADIIDALDWHDRQWIEGPSADEGYYIYKQNEPWVEGQVLAGNRLSTMGLCYWGLWKVTGNESYRERARKIGWYMKRRMGLFTGPTFGEGAYFWNYDLATTPFNNPLSENQLASLIGAGEDFSHAALTVAFPLTLGLEGEVFDQFDMEAFGRTITRGFGKLCDGVLFGNVAPTPSLGPDQVLIPGYFFRVAPFSPEGYDAIADFLLRYQKDPRNVDIAQLIRFKHDGPTPTSTSTPVSEPSPTPSFTSTSTPVSEPSATPTSTSTSTSTSTPEPTNTRTPTSTPTSTPTPSPSPTATANPISKYDVMPDPVDGRIDALDLLEWCDRIQNGTADNEILFDLFLYWHDDLN